MLSQMIAIKYQVKERVSRVRGDENMILLILDDQQEFSIIKLVTRRSKDTRDMEIFLYFFSDFSFSLNSHE